MKKPLTSSAVLVALFLSSLAAFAQAPAAQRKFDPRDLSGYWLRNAVRPREHPPLTPAGVAAMKGRVPDSKARVPTESNDPMYRCNPQGFPRLVWEENEPIEFIMLPGRVLQLFQWERTLRELWLDGRALPSGENLENLGPAWYGHSVARWEGETLVVQTVGLDDRAWIDIFGFPKSVEARFEERYRRIDADTIELRMTMWDPKYYEEPWVSDVKTFKRTPREDVTYFGWYGLFGGITDAICAPMNEVEDFNKRIRNPAGLGVQGRP